MRREREEDEVGRGIRRRREEEEVRGMKRKGGVGEEGFRNWGFPKSIERSLIRGRG